MQYRRLGRTDMEVSAIGFGAWAIGGFWGEMFDRGETFSGVPYDVGLDAVERLRPLVPPGATLAQVALRWILMFDAVTCAIPGARNEQQARENVRAASLAPLDEARMASVQRVYDEDIRPHVHARW